MSPLPRYRSVKRVMPRPPKHWVGDGFHVFPVFADLAFKEEISPLLMFDYAAPKQFSSKVGKPRGVGQHPHRGFETVTLAFQGEVEHHDSTGKSGVIKEGDVQWMTAGRGILHQEYHSKKLTREGGTFEMCQLWVNLPKKHKMAKPGYQGIMNENIPVVNLPLGAEEDSESLGTARIIAGELGDNKGAAKTYSPVQMWDVNLPKEGSEVEFPFAANHNCIVFVRMGSVEVLGGEVEDLKASQLGPQDVALMSTDGSAMLKVRVMEPGTSIMILGGEPLNEPIAHRGPFVMNTQEQLRQAMVDFQNGKMGR
ncbi:quercetin 2,3-dioxygenase PA2418 [Seminavis robusta]|uniref:Quercetin 2,3-dioxygenase PA2418 n=1 Tax=Seminavis robusta TaxID=568900 RepID=A0A9N8H964_9STRA|nr:quercetin 2,3-dioxygenase PA2418 [Seminavis robusta]|eukprot:Sro244_g097220.1 quercetin 2,3-dioxygenase PA2418 (310) ;mRNA; r:54914-55843